MLRDIHGLSVPKSGGAAMGPGSIAFFDKVAVQPDGSLTCFCTSGGCTAEEKKSRSKVAIPSVFLCVLNEKNKRDDTGKYTPSGYRQVYMADTEVSTIVTSESQLKDLITYYMAGEKDSKGDIIPPSGTPGFFVQVRQLAPDDMSDADKITFAENPATRATAKVFAWPNKGEPLPGSTRPVYNPPTVDEVIANLWAQHDDIKQVFGNPGYQFEVIPGLMASHVKSKVPSNIKDKKNERSDGSNSKDSAEQYKIIGPRPVDEPDAKLIAVAQGWRRSHGLFGHQPGSSFYQTHSDHLVNNKTPIYDTPDIPTRGMPDYHLAAVEKQAKVLGALKVEHYIQENPFSGKKDKPSGTYASPSHGPSR